MTSNHQYQALLPDLPLVVITPSESPLEAVLLPFAQDVFKLPLTSLEHPDVHWLNPSEPLKIEVVRQLQEMVGFKPYSLEQSLFILNQLENASQPAQQALLKLLEEPPEHVRLLMTVQQVSGILPTILSRCQVWQSSAAEVPQTEIAAEISNWHGDLSHQPLGVSMEVVETLSDREAALTWSTQLESWLHQQLQQSVTQPGAHSLVKQLQITQELQSWLQANVNVKLAMTEAVIRLKKVA